MAELFRTADLLRSVDLGAYAQKVHGYELRPRDGGPGIAVLEHAHLRDRVAVARTPEGSWVFADVRHYAPRGSSEPAERALVRLRDGIGRSPSNGGIVEFAQRVERLKRDREALELVAEMQRSHGYALCPRDGAQGVVVLEHSRLRDRVAVAQAPDGRWVFADVRQYAPRGPNEPAEHAFARLRECIDRSRSKGTLGELARRAEALEPGVHPERAAPTLARSGETLVMGRPGLGREDLKRELSQCRTDWQRFVPQPPGRGGRGPDRGR